MSTQEFSLQTPEKQQKKLIISIEGNIGAGKSTFLNILKNQQNVDFEFFPEDLEKWTNVDGQNINLLQMMYDDPARWGFLFNQYVMLTKLQSFEEIKQQTRSQICLTERSLLSDKNIFMKNFYLDKLQSKEEYVVYQEWFNFMTSDVNYKFNGIIYLKCSAETCHQRCQKRSRDEENGIKLEYLQQIHERHEEWLNYEREIPVLVIDTDQEFESNQERADIITQQVSQFIQQLNY